MLPDPLIKATMSLGDELFSAVPAYVQDGAPRPVLPLLGIVCVCVCVSTLGLMRGAGLSCRPSVRELATRLCGPAHGALAVAASCSNCILFMECVRGAQEPPSSPAGANVPIL